MEAEYQRSAPQRPFPHQPPSLGASTCFSPDAAETARYAALDAERNERDRRIGRGYDRDCSAPGHRDYLERTATPCACLGLDAEPAPEHSVLAIGPTVAAEIRRIEPEAGCAWGGRGLASGMRHFGRTRRTGLAGYGAQLVPAIASSKCAPTT